MRWIKEYTHKHNIYCVLLHVNLSGLMPCVFCVISALSGKEAASFPAWQLSTGKLINFLNFKRSSCWKAKCQNGNISKQTFPSHLTLSFSLSPGMTAGEPNTLISECHPGLSRWWGRSRQWLLDGGRCSGWKGGCSCRYSKQKKTRSLLSAVTIRLSVLRYWSGAWMRISSSTYRISSGERI